MAMMRCAKMAVDFGGAVETGASSGGASSPREMMGCERGRGTGGRPPVGDSLALNAPASLLSASPMARSDSEPESAAATASREGADASWYEIDGAGGARSEPALLSTSPVDGGMEPGLAESRFGFGGGASLREVGATES